MTWQDYTSHPKRFSCILCAHNQESNSVLHQKQCSQQVKGCNSPILVCFHKTPLGLLLHPVFKSPTQGRCLVALLWIHMKLFTGLKHFSYGDRPRELFSLKRWLHRDLHAPSSTKRDLSRRLETNFLQGHAVTGNGFKLKKGRFKLGIRKKFITVRVVRHRNRFPREVVQPCPTQAVFKVLSNVISGRCLCPWQGGLGLAGL